MTIQIQKAWKQRYIDDPKREHDHRSPFQRDRGRILHSAAFRCLQAKTQIHAVGENDFYRTRLTHSLEVAQIGSSLAAQLGLLEPFQALAVELNCAETTLQKALKPLLPPISLIETLCFAHDIGHPPFGHGGEVALNYMMAQHGGFEGNAQTFRLITKLEPYTEKAGMNLTRRAILGVVKYPAILDQASPQYAELATAAHLDDPRYINMRSWKPGKGLFRDDLAVFDWLLTPLTATDKQEFCRFQQPRNTAQDSLKTVYKSLDCSIMELADDIAYAVHDLEDAIVVGMVSLQQWQQAHQQLSACQSLWIRQNIDQLSEKLFSEHHYQRKNAIGALVNYFITSARWKLNHNLEEPLLRYNAELPSEVEEVLAVLKKFVWQNVICHVDTQRIEYKGQRILSELFRIFESDPQRLLPPNTVKRWQRALESDKKRIICDYIAGMSDAYALKVYQQL
ncbi:anti-phage deoxyguanosine triphosphatase [Testudinibacter sp. TR-2022]|uniref:anti-phage deoxyguanosine triphosphatase n=1 Tax=Testudinibacter sp. TR-2022 TaxID=2585029 RepID=UPI0011195223|nr:anti-phage deoxyguanosine triphosphatase [Testudinibacter sp. TR-2022]TNH06482.1 deoxyguanosinetriphosphate triphosphohydrolase family protein [Pasteurellaceae bacterium Phil11]TNH21999.1 deoxyguanosinetriphosphate triphosphohydrolase family protein [Testudinibacter sp. TR-2022]TNH28599.1 deoxyguanosinetriphosphate triphosphohydrolase family protein [Testudinibacter sp. TR-2022]